MNRPLTHAVLPAAPAAAAVMLLLAAWLASAPLAADAAAGLRIDPDRVTVSGFSSGAHMAHQLHIAYSDLFSGAALLSGGPWGCAEGSLVTAMSRCTDNSGKPLPVEALLTTLYAAAERGDIAEPGNLADDRIWLFHGSEDDAVAAPVHDGAGAIYAGLVPAARIRSVDDVPAGHVFPTDGHGGGCTEFEPPFVGDCGYDAAGELLQQLYPRLVAPQDETAATLRTVTLPGADGAGLLDQAYLYVPAACAGGRTPCALHLVLHGCAQSTEKVGTGFIEQSGYLPWAEANGIVLAFPQVEASMVLPLNPLGCWDWWGYTGDDYLWRDGAQLKVLADWVKTMAASE